MKILSLFSGIGAFEKALDNLGIEHELAGFSEIDKYAVQSYCAIHGVDESLNYGDITKINEKNLPKDLDLITYGFPCQDISLAGKQKGMFNADGTQTRSGLFFEALRIIEETQPKVAIAENVKNLTSKKFKLQFDIVLRCLEAAGYNNYWKVLNAKDYGIPPGRIYDAEGISPAMDTCQGGNRMPKVVEPFIVASRGRNPENPSDRTAGAPTEQRLEPNSQGICNTLTTVQKDNYVAEPVIYDDYNDRADVKTVEKIANIYPSGGQNGNIYSTNGLSPTIVSGETNTKGNGGIGSSNAPKIFNDLRIRKLTPKECYRLMGFDDIDHDRAAEVVSNSQLYKQAGNSIVVDVLEHLLPNVLKAVE